MIVLFTWETPLVNPWPPVHLFTLIGTFIHHFSSSLLHWSIFIIHLFHYTINRFVFCGTGNIDNLSAVGGKVFWLSVCRSTSVKIKRQRSSTFTLLLISRSYWFDKHRFVIERKLLLAVIPSSLGSPPNSSQYNITPLIWMFYGASLLRNLRRLGCVLW